MGVPPGNRPAVPRDWFRGVPKRYVAGAETRGRQEGRPYPWSQHVIHEISGLGCWGNQESGVTSWGGRLPVRSEMRTVSAVVLLLKLPAISCSPAEAGFEMYCSSLANPAVPLKRDLRFATTSYGEYARWSIFNFEKCSAG
jgi:hypothetical protein